MRTTQIFVVLIVLAAVVGGIIWGVKNTGVLDSNSGMKHVKQSYSIKPAYGKIYPINTPLDYSFSIEDQQGGLASEFAITHTKLMHVIVVRKDLAYFQHVHPEFNPSTKIFTVKNLTFPTNGEYRIFADFAVNTGQKNQASVPSPITVSDDVSVGDAATYKPQFIGTEETTKVFDGIQTTLTTHGQLTTGNEVMLMFNLSENGKPVTDLEPYLGALGHSVILKEATLDFIHAHPAQSVEVTQTGAIDFMVKFPKPGTYKVFSQFQRGGKVITTDFVLSVAQGQVNNPSTAGDHSTH